jgi:hypothetical protein
MPTNPMLSAGHMGIVDAMKYGTTRDDVTLAAALAAIGSNPAMLLLPLTGDGVWTFDEPVVIPANVVLYQPPGVQLINNDSFIHHGQYVSYSVLPTGGTGPVTFDYALTNIGALHVYKLGVNAVAPLTLLHVLGNAAANAIVRIEALDGVSQAGIQWWTNGSPKMTLQVMGAQDVVLTLANGADLQVLGGKLGLDVLPTHLLQLGSDDAYKPGGGVWGNSSDARLKTVLGPYTDGLTMLKTFAPVNYTYNGKGNTPTDGKHYVGVLAQDVQGVAPYMVGSELGKLEPSDEMETELLTFDGSALVYALINAVKELAARVEALEAALP